MIRQLLLFYFYFLFFSPSSLSLLFFRGSRSGEDTDTKGHTEDVGWKRPGVGNEREGIQEPEGTHMYMYMYI